MDAAAAKMRPMLAELREEYPQALIEDWDVAGAVKEVGGQLLPLLLQTEPGWPAGLAQSLTPSSLS